MFNYIINFFKKEQSDVPTQNQSHNEQPQHNQLFNEQYRIAYNKLWINSLRNYKP